MSRCGNAVVDRELEHLRIDHDQPALLWPQPVEQAQDHGVDGDRFAGAGGAGDQQVRHAREIDDHRLAADGLAQAERQLCRRVDVVAGGELLAQEDLLARRVRQLDADGVASRDHGDARGERAHGAGDVVGEPDHARRFDARRGLELVERDHRAGPRIDDLAAHAEVAEHAFERGGVGLQRVGAQHGAAGAFRRSQELERRQHIAAERPARLRRGLGLARRARGVFLLLFVLVLLFLLVHPRLQRGAGAIVEARFGRAPRSTPLARREQAPKTRLEAQKAVGDPAERDRAALLFGFVGFLLLLALIGFAVPAEAGGDREADQCRDAGGDGHRQAHKSCECSAGEERRQPQHPIADHAAESGRQRPARAARQRGRKAGSQQYGQDPEDEPDALAPQRPVGGEPPAPDGDRQNERDRGHAEHLHQQVGNDRAGLAEHVAHGRGGGVAQRWVLHRPGRERECEQDGERNQREAAELAHAPAQRVAHRVGQEAQAVEAAVDRRHGPPVVTPLRFRTKRYRLVVENASTQHALTPAPRRGDAAPRRWSPDPAPWRRGYSRGRDCEPSAWSRAR